MASGLAIVEGEVRELVRRRQLDPVLEPDATRRLVEEVLSDYLDRAAMSALPPLGDPVAAARRVFDQVAGFGPLQRYFDDREVEEIWINEPGRVFIARRGRSELTTVILSSAEVADLVERMLRLSGRRLDLSAPFVDAQLPDGSRLHVVIPSITRLHMAVNIRKFVVSVAGLDELVRLGSLPERAARFLQASVTAGLNVLVSGGTQAGKTTMLNALCASIPAAERVITAEEVFELQVPLPDVVSMQTRQPNLEGTGEISLRRLVKEALRMRPNRIIVGEVRQEERHRRLGYQRGADSAAGHGVGILGCGVVDAMGGGLRGIRRAAAGRVGHPRQLLVRRGVRGFPSSPRGRH
jgi:pilus assembly protein CpaF